MKTQFKNRDRRILTLEEIEPDKFKLSGYLDIGVRFSKDINDNITMVDPSGGPYISLGEDLNYYFDNKLDKKLIIKVVIISSGVALFGLLILIMLSYFTRPMYGY